MNLILTEASRSCIMVIDPQERLMKVVQQPETVVKNTAILLQCAQVLKIPVIASTQYKKGLGPIVEELSSLLTKAFCFDKMEFNCFLNPLFRAILAKLPASVDTLVLTGVEAHICVFQTAVAAMNHGFKVWVASDAVSSRVEQNKTEALSLLQSGGACCAGTETITYQLHKRADTSQFKSMLKYLK